MLPRFFFGNSIQSWNDQHLCLGFTAPISQPARAGFIPPNAETAAQNEPNRSPSGASSICGRSNIRWLCSPAPSPLAAAAPGVRGTYNPRSCEVPHESAHPRRAGCRAQTAIRMSTRQELLPGSPKRNLRIPSKQRNRRHPGVYAASRVPCGIHSCALACAACSQ